MSDEANEPSYEQLGEAGNPFSDSAAADPEPDVVGQNLEVDSEDEVDRAERHD